MFNKKSLTVALIAGAFSWGASADVIYSSSGLSLIEDFESFDGLVTQGPVSLAGGVSVTSTVNSTIGAFGVDLVNNGTWGAGNNFAGIGDLFLVQGPFDGSMTFSFSQAVSSVGALFSIFNDGYVPGEITIEALGAGGTALDWFAFTVDLGDQFANNVGLFRGFQRTAADIFGLRVSGDGFVIDNLSVAVVPLPAALPLLLAGLGGLAGIGGWRRRSSRTQ